MSFLNGRGLSLSVIVLGMMAVPAFGQSINSGFTDQQQDEIRELVRDYILQNPGIILESVAIMQARQRAEEDAQAKTALIEKRDALERDPADPVLGNPDGTVTLVEFFDYQCGYCKTMLGPLRAMLKDNSDVRVVMKEFPILGDASVIAARASLAANRQGKYLEFHTALLSYRGRLNEQVIMQVANEAGLDMKRLVADMNSREVQAQITQTYELAKALSIEGTPAFTIDGQLIPGAVNRDQLAALIESARTSASN
ncbi:MAG: DsbA family protein [Alphaproteobacteria bacterium]|nr:DsbA family protein [Alphaproteobacteria bacterium]